MREILLGTTNPSKIKRFQALLKGYEVSFLTLKDLGITEEPEEEGRTPEENAVQKARFYSRYFDTVLCNDSGLYFDALPLDDPRQPGVHVRTPGGRPRMSDEEMTDYYRGLVRSLGGKALTYYWDGFAVYRRGKVSSFMAPRETVLEHGFYMVDELAPSGIRRPGWPMDTFSVERDTGIYFVDRKWDSAEREEIITGDYRRQMTAFLVEALELRGE